MDLLKQAKKIVHRLTSEGVAFALAGGLASSIYRKNKRSTDDLDFLIYSKTDSEKKARAILSDFDLEVHEAREANLKGGRLGAKSKSTPIFILLGRKEGSIGIDFILPTIPWFARALERAQSNILDFGDLKIPCLTAEDIVVSKLYSLENDSSRFSDADDLKSIFENKEKLQLDLSYISIQMKALDILVPLSLDKFAPPSLLKLSRAIKREVSARTRRSKQKES